MRALIVEDERTPREILRDLVPWSRYGFDRVDTARNGLEALEVLQEGGIDLVLTDVRMPKMDGVELALEVHRRWPDCVLIFLSGYSDKEYLKTAIRVQALDYLDKPIDLAVVSEAIAEAVRTLQQKQAVRGLSPLRRQALVLALLGLGPESGALPEPGFQRGPLRVLVLSPSPGIEPPAEWRPSVLARINGEDSPRNGLIAAPGPGLQIFVICDHTLGGDPAFFEQVAQTLLAHADTDGSLRLRAGLSLAVSGPEGLRAGLAEAQSALTDAFYRPDLLLHSVRPPSGRILDLSDDLLASWSHLMESQDFSSVIRQLVVLEQRSMAAREPDHEHVRAVWLRAMEFLLGFVPSWGAPERGARAEKLRRELWSAPDLTSIAACARDCFDRLFLQSPGDLHVGDRVQKARSFIEEKFADPDLTVDAIAVHVGFSESYFCTVFKQAQGITVKDFVNRHRIERAKAYLWEKEPPTLADLALKVGFRDPNYFSTVFKRHTGTSPGAYRKKALG